MATMEEMCIAEGLMTPTEIGWALRFTLAEAYKLASKGDYILATVDPLEFVTMTESERRYHRRALKRMAAA
jgi:hypothetical protein